MILSMQMSSFILFQFQHTNAISHHCWSCAVFDHFFSQKNRRIALIRAITARQFTFESFSSENNDAMTLFSHAGISPKDSSDEIINDFEFYFGHTSIWYIKTCVKIMKATKYFDLLENILFSRYKPEIGFKRMTSLILF